MPAQVPARPAGGPGRRTARALAGRQRAACAGPRAGGLRRAPSGPGHAVGLARRRGRGGAALRYLDRSGTAGGPGMDGAPAGRLARQPVRGARLSGATARTRASRRPGDARLHRPARRRASRP
ncbi:hypothetical protein CNMCM8686_008313 [Aspergillus fumigatus]|nr:hypothetical protein CNMCM8686_008313 [Aspergillus fumigatus]